MNKHVLYRKQLDLLVLAKKYLAIPNQENFDSYIKNVRDAIPDLFYESQYNLKSEFVELIPTDKLSRVRRLLELLRCISGIIGDQFTGNYNSCSASIIIHEIDALEKTMKVSINQHSQFTVFYCWESDLSSRTNRNYIQSCIEKAIGKLNDESDIKLCLDKDTLGSTGSPDIFPTILKKIETALVFIADITPVTMLQNKAIPNPNVMCELGYALSSISDERVIMLFNKADGMNPKDLPFDLGLKRTMMYNYSESDSPPKKNELVSKLYDAIKIIRDL
ncbi:MAG: hypothetical protein K2K89_12730 [Ruminococcus sp.]|nr:hypothetical protein [Ruminococcus sp.]